MVGVKGQSVIVSILVMIAIFLEVFAPLTRAAEWGVATPPLVPVVKRDTLLNGLQLATIEQPGSGMLSLQISVNSGAMFDLLGKGGMADLTGGMLLRGSGGLTAKQLSETADQFGIRVSVEVGWDVTKVMVAGPSDAVETMFDLLGRIILSPAFDRTELEALKKQRADELKTEEANNESLLIRRAMESVYGMHPFGKPARGSSASLNQISRDDLVYFYNKFYLANNSLLVATGDIHAEQVSKLSRTKLGAWRKGDRVSASFRPPEPSIARRVLLLDRAAGLKAETIIVQPGLSRQAEDYLAAFLMIEILKARLASSSAGSSKVEAESRKLPGPILIHINSTLTETSGAIDRAIAAMAAMQKELPATEELGQAKSRLVSEFSQRLQTSPADVLLDIELYGLGKDYYITFAERVNSLRPEEVQKAAQRYLRPETATIVVLGAAKSIEKEINRLGAVTVLP